MPNHGVAHSSAVGFSDLWPMSLTYEDDRQSRLRHGLGSRPDRERFLRRGGAPKADRDSPAFPGKEGV